MCAKNEPWLLRNGCLHKVKLPVAQAAGHLLHIQYNRSAELTARPTADSYIQPHILYITAHTSQAPSSFHFAAAIHCTWRATRRRSLEGAHPACQHAEHCGAQLAVHLGLDVPPCSLQLSHTCCMLLHTQGGGGGAHAADAHAAGTVPTLTAAPTAGHAVDTNEGEDVLHQGVTPATHGPFKDEVCVGTTVNQPASTRRAQSNDLH
jgi:hypothetical protein